MATTLTSLPQMTNEEATEASSALNSFYEENELGGSIVSKIGQINSWFLTSMPKTREEEYIAGDDTKKCKFALIGALANVNQSAEKTFLVAWEEQYTIMFG